MVQKLERAKTEKSFGKQGNGGNSDLILKLGMLEEFDDEGDDEQRQEGVSDDGDLREPLVEQQSHKLVHGE